MKNNPLVSIITVVFNGEKYLEETIQSVINQSYSNIEYIVIDGGSSDRTINIIKKYEDNISLWKTKKDAGIYDAMNKGLSFANGDWLNFMNAGDSFVSDNSVANFMKYSNLDKSLIFSDVLLIDDKGAGKKIVQNGFKKYFFYRNICHQSVFYNYKKLKKVLFYNLKYMIAADFDLLLRIYIEDIPNFSIKNNRADVKYLDGGLSSLSCIERVDERRDILKANLSYFSIEHFMNSIKTKFNRSKCKKHRLV
jgi:glycosyltransferase involved in cell wall biosynthesis